MMIARLSVVDELTWSVNLLSVIDCELLMAGHHIFMTDIPLRLPLTCEVPLYQRTMQDVTMDTRKPRISLKDYRSLVTLMACRY